jgi:hypothetical protein
MTTSQDVTIFEGDQGPAYVRWIESHPSGTVLVVKCHTRSVCQT